MKIGRWGSEARFRWANQETVCIVKQLYGSDDFAGWCRRVENAANEYFRAAVDCGPEFLPHPIAVVAGELLEHFQDVMPKGLRPEYAKLLSASLLRVDWKQIAIFLADANQEFMPAHIEAIYAIESFETMEYSKRTSELKWTKTVGRILKKLIDKAAHLMHLGVAGRKPAKAIGRGKLLRRACLWSFTAGKRLNRQEDE